jgi:ubiquinone/menaquinone biosynthesis C-methylase UbiE
MLDVAVAKLQQSGLDNWQVEVADHRELPLEDDSVDVVLSGWSLVYTAIWSPEPWEREVDRALAEMKRILRPSGTIIVLETMGTGHEQPNPPEDLLGYFAYLEASGFSSTWIRTDYSFRSLDEAEDMARFFFGDELAREVRERNWTILPECTGLWWQHQGPSSRQLPHARQTPLAECA